MSTPDTAALASRTSDPAGSSSPARAATFLDALRAEVTKAVASASTYWSLLAMVVVGIGISALASWGTATAYEQMPPIARAQVDPVSYSLAGLSFGTIGIAVLGVLVVSSEYTTGLIRVTLAAVPRRWRVLAAKAVALLVVALVIGLAVSLASFALGQVFFGAKGLGVGLSDDHALRAVVGGGLLTAGTALFALALGALIRHTAGAIATMLGVMLVPTILGPLLPHWWQDNLVRYLPFNAGGQILVTHVTGPVLTPWNGLLVFAAWVVVGLVAAFWLLARRDA